MIRLILIFSLSCLSANVFAQILQFERYKDWGYDDLYTTSCMASDTTVMTTYGSMRNGVEYVIRNGGRQNAFQSGLTLLSSNGDSLQTVADVTKYGGSIAITKAHYGYASVFYRVFVDTVERYQYELSLYGNSGVLFYSAQIDQEFSRSNFYNPKSLLFNPSDSCLYLSSSIINQSTGFDIALQKFSKQGLHLWTRVYRIPGNQLNDYLHFDINNRSMLLACRSRGGVSYVLNVDTAGTLLFARELYVPIRICEYGNLKRTPDGGYVGVLDGDSGFFFKYDSQFQLVYLEKFKYIDVQSLNVFDDGSVAMRNVYDRFSFDSLIKIDPNNGQRIWGCQVREPGASPNFAVGFNYFSNGDVLMTGYRQGNQFQTYDFYWAKISNFGHPFDPVTATMPRAQQKPAWLGLLPNPARDVVSISCSAPPRRSYIYSSTGRLVHQFTGFKANISSLPAGIYLVQTELQNGQRATAKLVKE